MTWSATLQKTASPEKRVWTSNEEILEEFTQYLERNHYSKNVLKHRPTYVRAFMRMWGSTLVTRLEDHDIQLYVDTISAKCAKFLVGQPPRCWKGHDMGTCPMARAHAGLDADLASCPDYRPLDPAGVWSNICEIKAFYTWLLTEGYIKFNPAEPVQIRFRMRHKGIFIKRGRKPRRRVLRLDEVRALVQGSPINRAIMYALMAKCFLRLHEAVKISVHPAHFNLDEGWIELPEDWDYGGKRLGNNRIILDAELRVLMRRYLTWRERKVKRGPDGTPFTDKLILTQFGVPWTPDHFRSNARQALHRDCIRLGLMTGKETSRQERINPHCFRAFASTWARDRRARDAELEVLRGDRAPGSIDRYDEYLPRLPELYRKYAPFLGL